MPKYKTKWDHLNDADRAGLERTPCNLTCARCGLTLVTEADFAKHFIVPDARYLNLGECPNEVLNRPEVLDKYHT